MISICEFKLYDSRFNGVIQTEGFVYSWTLHFLYIFTQSSFIIITENSYSERRRRVKLFQWTISIYNPGSCVQRYLYKLLFLLLFHRIIHPRLLTLRRPFMNTNLLTNVFPYIIRTILTLILLAIKSINFGKNIRVIFCYHHVT